MKTRQLFEEFILQNLDNAYRFAFTYTKNKEDAEDIVNESVIKALRSIGKLKNTEYMKPWFYKIIVNTALTQRKQNSRVISVDFGESGEEIAPYCEDDYSDITLEDILKVLDEKYRCVIVLKICEDMTFREIAEIMDISEGTVKTRFYKALEILKADLGGERNA